MNWDVETACDASLTGKIDDTIWVIHARKNNRIAITFDELKAQQGKKISRELRSNGGRIIRIQGGPEQNTYRSVGKLLFHYQDWYPFLSQNDGISVVSDVRTASCRNYTPEEYHHHYHRTDAEQFEKYLEGRKHKPYRPRGRKKRPHSDSQGLLT